MTLTQWDSFLTFQSTFKTLEISSTQKSMKRFMMMPIELFLELTAISKLASNCS